MLRSLIIPRSTRNAIGAALVIIASVLLITVSMSALAADLASASPTRTTCAEDDPCWSWSTMGNHKRGVVTLYGNARVVGPCAFKRLWEAGHLAYSVRVDGRTYGHVLTPLRGDAWARTHGCINAQDY